MKYTLAFLFVAATAILVTSAPPPLDDVLRDATQLAEQISEAQPAQFPGLIRQFNRISSDAAQLAEGIRDAALLVQQLRDAAQIDTAQNDAALLAIQSHIEPNLERLLRFVSESGQQLRTRQIRAAVDSAIRSLAPMENRIQPLNARLTDEQLNRQSDRIHLLRVLNLFREHGDIIRPYLDAATIPCPNGALYSTIVKNIVKAKGPQLSKAMALASAAGIGMPN